MKVPFLELRKIYDQQAAEVELAVQRVLRSGWYLLGNECSQFEANMKEMLVGSNPGQVVGCNSGTDALLLSLVASGVGPGDEVVTVAHTAIPTIAAIVASRAQPIFCDIDAKTFLMDLSRLAQVITPKTKAVIPVHLYGNMVDIPSLQQVLSQLGREDIIIIEDCAQSQGSRWNNQSAGTMGRFGAFSFYPSKNLGALGDGGAIFCSDEGDAKRLKMLRFYGQESRYKAEIGRGINSRLDEVQAAVLNVRLKTFDSNNRIKLGWVELYRNLLKGLPLEFQTVTPSCEPAWHLFVVATETGEARDQLKEFLAKEGIEALIHYPIPNHQQAAFRSFATDSLPVTESVAGRVLSLPMNAASKKEEIEFVATKIREFYRR